MGHEYKFEMQKRSKRSTKSCTKCREFLEEVNINSRCHCSCCTTFCSLVDRFVQGAERIVGESIIAVV